MPNLFKNQRNLFLLTTGITLIIVVGWYFGHQQRLSASYSKTQQTLVRLTNTRDNYRKMQKSVGAIESEWQTLYDDFQTTLSKIPHRSHYDNVSNNLYSLIISVSN